MAERAYTVSEIDRIRNATQTLFGYRERIWIPKGTVLEELVRTYLIAGVSAEDVEKEAAAASANTTSKDAQA